ncbi:pyrroloquinoline quinone biosynthesis peptide chaperone PqqD [Ancylobacter mangrovi]|uniref:Pyrroloquinoline quinone biosynthesis peptide chaperone PqqD n=1 Tax=Ancylobacter mangrovi TaxID=2972472 RepID=A0A9X2PFW7_9HYPH|nr:pyrroloquinoline quinone biosynthesis peptide chaperone PqqD [Ancylobacter mangrovi]MCS0496231.1 pyrroloquinoline quinone biosynthesis peptide chaperone PqqD [Ancylobacter mangrovi]MCS0504229.1 pyrroloquinoline quinone biosynthesis peptide chaperone PqqD [Ancylobacter mangrovi]
MTVIPATAVPRLVRGVRLRHDEARGQWVLLAPERVLNPDPVAVEILKKVDGTRSVEVIIDELVSAFTVDRERVASDVDAFLAGLKEKGLIETMPSPIGDAAS